ncbi:MAG: pantetheine-phosphate adenylyltransferase [Dehalococcoidia bacterium]|nr:MAG: pantetheine-phosphate adenylyltransferase [Dehalococcoidia bacterium]
MKKCIIAASMDPITLGHINVIERALKLFDQVIVGVGVNPNKKYTFSLEMRVSLAERALNKFGKKILVKPFEGLLVDFAYENCIETIIRGVRNSSDVDFEKMLHDINRSQNLGIESHILFADQNHSHISSSAVKELQKHHAKNVLEYVPLCVKKALEMEVSGQFIIGVTGEIGAGKSYVTDKLMELEDHCLYEMNNIDMDRIGHYLLEKCRDPIAHYTRKRLRSHFGDEIIKDKKNLFVDTKALGKKLWGDEELLTAFNTIVKEPMLLLFRRELATKQGVIFVNSALLAEAGLTEAVNNIVLLVKAPEVDRIKRLKTRGYSEKEIKDRVRSQLNSNQKIEIIKESIRKHDFGSIHIFENGIDANIETMKSEFKDMMRKWGIYANQ